MIKKIPAVLNIIKRIKPADLQETIRNLSFGKEELLIVDVGANKGQSIDLFLNLFPKSKIFSFEPTLELFDHLKTKYQITNNVHLINLALSDKTGNLKFYLSKFSPTNSLLKPNLELYKKYNPSLESILEIKKEAIVSAQRFEDWYKLNLNEQMIDIFKTDTQGYDYNVLRGAENILCDKIKTIIVETQYREFYKDAVPFYKIYELLYESGFQLFNIIPSSRNNRIELLESDCVFVNKKYFKN